MTRIYVQRGSSTGGTSQNPNTNANNPNQNPNHGRAGAGSSTARPEQTQVQSAAKDEESVEEQHKLTVGDEVLEYAGTSNRVKNDELFMESLQLEESDAPLGMEVLADVPGKDVKEEVEGSQESIKGLTGERPVPENEGLCEDNSVNVVGGGSHPPPPPVPPPKPSATNLTSRRGASGSPNAVNAGSPRRTNVWPVVSARSSPAGSRSSSPKAHNESDGYNSADEQNPCYVSSYADAVS